MEAQAGSPPSLRASNRLRVIQALQVLGVTSRADVARYTGLSRSTVSTIVAGLQAEGMVVDRDADGRASAGGGRPPAMIALDPAAGFAIGVDFGKRHLAVALADLSHELLAEEWREMSDDYDAEAGIDQAAELVEIVLAASGVDAGRVLGVGMGLPGPVHRTGVVGSSAILPGWAGTRAADRMGERLAMEVWLRNDANLGALAESIWGAGRETDGLVYLKLATGIGAGIVLRGRLFEGAGGTAGEIGHTSLDETGDICRCGSRGCLETYASGSAIAALLSRSLGEPMTFDDVMARAVDGDPGSRRALADAGRHIGAAVADLCNLINPERIVVGGSMAVAGDVLLDPLREAVGLRAIPSAAEDVRIVPGELGERAELLGAVALVLHEAGPAWSGPAPAIRQSTATR
jgi:predicted NBD/HSP70 family sugar kinase/biotin operon repressor